MINIDQVLARTKAFQFCKDAHDSIKQVRKYSGDPYWTHPYRVSCNLANAGVHDIDVITAAYLHDILEDVWPKNPKYSPAEIQKVFGPRVLSLVQELTDEFTPDKHPTVNRAGRKAAEATRLSHISVEAMMIKLADLIDNTSDILRNDPGYARVYFAEKRRILELMNPTVLANSGNASLRKLFAQASAQVNKSI